MAAGGDCLETPQDGEVVPVYLDAGMLKALDAYCRSLGVAERGEAINELLMIGLSYAMPESEPPDS